MTFEEEVANQTVHIVNSWPDVPIAAARKIARENILERRAWRALAGSDSPTVALEARKWLHERHILSGDGQ